tara:strand:- start:1517 stop:2701 length:1185 start_codon:yes stop_codon:yes gene_type:complete
MGNLVPLVIGFILLFAAIGGFILIARGALDRNFKNARDESRKDRTELIDSFTKLGTVQQEKLNEVNAGLENLRSTVRSELETIRTSNEIKLEAIRKTVDEELQSTLEKRLGESFKLVSSRLEAVQAGLGEMRTLATGVGDLKKVLTNVKARGTWGEVQLESLLEQILTPDQYDRNVKTNNRTGEMVEFAVKLPGQNNNLEEPVWLPIDAKFPQEDYLRLMESSDAGDTKAVEQSRESLVRSIKNSAKDIQKKYLNPPATTDFAILFLPTEGLYAEVLRTPGLIEELQNQQRIVISGPTTLAATLSSLRMGFRTLAIEKRSSEVWKVLSAVKTEFSKFGEALGKVRRQLDTASNSLEDLTITRTRAMERKLKSVETLPEVESEKLLDLQGEPNDD